MTHVKDLSERAGIPLALNLESGALLLGDHITSDPPGVRTLEQMRSLLADASAQGPSLFYHLYRAVHHDNDIQVVGQAGLRYDLTVTMPGTVGAEYVKTSGHYHTRNPRGITYPEAYEVLNGSAAFLLQRVDDPEQATPRVREVWVVTCDVGEKIVIPPDCGHVTINIGTEPLVVSDLISLDSQHIYHPFREVRGAAYYVLADPQNYERFRIVQNSHYPAPIPVLQRFSGSRWSPFLPETTPLYTLFLEYPKKLKFLNTPEDYLEQMLSLWQANN